MCLGRAPRMAFEGITKAIYYTLGNNDVGNIDLLGFIVIQ